MSTAEGYYGEIRAFAGDTVPDNWLPCNGQVLQIPSNPALFSVIGTAYGGDGARTFALPDLTGRTVVGTPQFPGAYLG